MDFAFVVRQRLDELGFGQRELAAACEVTESYISQLLGRKKLPPLPNRTDLYEKMSRLLGVPRDELARLAALQHHEVVDRTWRAAPAPRLGPMRELILQKCRAASQPAMRSIFEKEEFGYVEQLITRALIEAVRDEARAHARDEQWLRSISANARNSYRTMRVRLIDLLDSDPAVSIGDYSLFIDPMIRSWEFDLHRFSLTIRLTGGTRRAFSFEQRTKTDSLTDEPALRSFLRDATLSAGITADETEFLTRIRFAGPERPTALFYYRTLQNLRDPLNFRAQQPAP
ncbi:MAG TPA: helix-turn-helix transcriptional regulator [Thermoanaerobaculia bacterium]|nr:helix-turn-helix transcriptional regulator [Thermoanaerobaculia bacterium]